MVSGAPFTAAMPLPLLNVLMVLIRFSALLNWKRRRVVNRFDSRRRGKPPKLFLQCYVSDHKMLLIRQR